MEEESIDIIDAKAKAAAVVMATTTTTRAGAMKRTHAEPTTLPIVNASGARRCTKENAKNLGRQQITMGTDSTSKNSFL